MAFQFTATITDHDGDQSITPPHIITVTDGTLPTAQFPSGNTVTTLLDEADIVDSDSGSVSITAGSDQISSIAFNSDLSLVTVDTNGNMADNPDVIWQFNAADTTVIEGRVDGNLALTIQLNAPATIAAGATENVEVNVNLLDSLSHIAGNGNNSLTISGVTISINDADGDEISVPVEVTITDDIPTINLAVNSGGATILNTQDADTVGSPDTASAIFAVGTVFDSSIDYGADDSGSVNYTYALNLLGVSGIDSGLDSRGEDITLITVDDDIIGSTINGEIFRFSVNETTGELTLNQSAPIDHPTPGDNSDFDLQTIGLPTGLVALTVTGTITDSDGDTQNDQASFDLGNYVIFSDDGPAITANAANVPTLTVNESDLNTNAVTGFASVFNTDYGADGAGAVGNYQLSISSEGLSSGLVDLATGELVRLYSDNGDIVGRSDLSQEVVFRISVHDSTGQVTLDQIRTLDHTVSGNPVNTLGMAADRIQLAATITDNDGDNASAQVNIGDAFVFQDDTPQATISVIGGASIVLDETVGGSDVPDDDFNTPDGFGTPIGQASATLYSSAASTADFGADSSGATSHFSLTIHNSLSGLTTSNGTDIYLFSEDDNTVTGRAGNNSAGEVILRFDIDDSGVVTVTQYAGLQHPAAPDSYDESIFLNADILSATLTVIDGDGDSSTDQSDLGGVIAFQDDGPLVTINPAVVDGTPNVDDVNQDNTINSTLSFDYGQDGGSLTQIFINGDLTTPYNLNQDITVIGDDTLGVLTIQDNGNWTFVADENISNSETFTFTVRSTDTDGDVHQDSHSINVIVPSSPAPVNLSVNETTVNDAIADNETDSQTVTFDPGASVIDRYAFDISAISTDSDNNLGADISWTLVNDTTLRGYVDLDNNGSFDDEAITLTLVSTANPNEVTVQAQIVDNFLHPDNGGINNFFVTGLIVSAIDSADATISSANVSIEVTDVIPTVDISTPVSVTVYEDGLADGIGAGNTMTTGDLSVLVDFQGDDPGVFGFSTNWETTLLGLGLTVASEALNYDLSGDTLTAYVNNIGSPTFTFMLNNDGTFTFTLQGPIDHQGNSDDNEGYALPLGQIIVASDADGDMVSLSGGLTVNIDNDIPTAALQGDASGALSVDESDIVDSTGPVSFSQYFDLNSGADSTQSTDYTLVINNAGNTGLTDTLTGEPVTLASSGDDIIGENTNGDTVFTLSVDNNGNVTLILSRPVEHADTDDPNDSITLNPGSIGLQASISDNDNDTATIELDISQAVEILDDGPAISVNAANIPAMLVNETTLSSDVVASFATVFTPVYGSDGQGSIHYALGVTEGTDTGWVDTATGQLVSLHAVNDTIIEMRNADGNVVFTLQVNNSGEITFDQQRAIVHSDTGDPNDTSTQLAANLIQLTATVTDGDGDEASASADIAGALTVLDDGPSISLNVVDNDSIILNTQDADTIGSASDSVSASFAAAFTLATSTFGNDGAGTVQPLVFSLNILNATSGLFSQGESIQLSMDNGDIVGATINEDIFRLSVDNAGTVTLTQYAQIDHPLPGDTSDYANQQTTLATNILSLSSTATVIDGDGDSASSTQSIDLSGNILFDDDGPSRNIGLSAIAVTVLEDGMSTADGDLSTGYRDNGETSQDDEGSHASSGGANLSTLFNSGADAPLTFSLLEPDDGNLPTLFSNGDAISYQLNGNILAAIANGRTVFTLTVNTDGSWQFDLLDQLDHSLIQGENSGLRTSIDDSTPTIAAIDFSSIIRATDADGDSSTDLQPGDFTITVLDDAPIVNPDSGIVVTAGIEEDGMSLTQSGGFPSDNTEGNKDAGDSNIDDESSGAASSLSALFISGADETLSISISLTGNVIDMPVYFSNGYALNYAINNNVLTASYIDSEGETVTVFELTVNSDGSWVFDLRSPLDHAAGNGENLPLLVDTDDDGIADDTRNFLDFSAILVATDSDGDTARLDETDRFTIVVEDDVPVLTEAVEQRTVAEGGSSISGDLSSLVSLGSDGPRYFMLRDLSDFITYLPNLTTNGEAITYVVNNNELAGIDGEGNEIFRLTLEVDGTYQFDVFGLIDHPAAGGALTINFSSAIAAFDNDLDPVTLGTGAESEQFIIDVTEDDQGSLYLSTSLGGVTENLAGFYGLSLLSPIDGGILTLVNQLIGPGGLLEGETFEDALSIVLEQQGVFDAADILKLNSDDQFNMFFNSSEHMQFSSYDPSSITALLQSLGLDLPSLMSLLGFDINALHVLGDNRFLFSLSSSLADLIDDLPAGVGDEIIDILGLPNFDNEDILLATQNTDGSYSFSTFFNGSANGLDDSLLESLLNPAIEFNIDGISYEGAQAPGDAVDLDNGTLYFTLADLVDVDVGQLITDLLGNALGSLTLDASDVIAIDRVGGVWQTDSYQVIFDASDIGLNDVLLGNALDNLNDANLAGLVTDLLDPDIKVIDIDGITLQRRVDSQGQAYYLLYFSLSPVIDIDLPFNTLGEILSDPTDPLSALTFKGEDILAIRTIAGEGFNWDPSTLSLYFNGSIYHLNSDTDLLSGLFDNLVENIDAFSIGQDTMNYHNLAFSTQGGGNDPQLGSYDAQTAIQYHNGTFSELFNLATESGGSVTNENLSALHVSTDGMILFTLDSHTTLPDIGSVEFNDIIQWDGTSFSMFQSGSALGLDSSTPITSLYVFPDTHPDYPNQIAFSLGDNGSIGSINYINQDILLFDPVTDNYSLLFDGSSAGIEDLSLSLDITADLSSGGYDTLITNTVDSALTNVTSEFESLLIDLDTALQAIEDDIGGGLLGGLLGALVGLVSDLLDTIGSLLSSIDVLSDITDTLQSEIQALIADASQFIQDAVGEVSQTLIDNAQNALDAVGQLNDILLALNDEVTDLMVSLDAGASVDIQLIDHAIDAAHIRNDGDFLLSFRQVIDVQILLTAQIGALDNLIDLGITVNSEQLLSDLNDIINDVIEPVLASTNILDVFDEINLDLTGMNVYQFHFDDGLSQWQIQLFTDGQDAGLDNTAAVDTVTDSLTNIADNLNLINLLDLRDAGLLDLSSNENIDALYLFENNSVDIQGVTTNIQGSVGNDYLIGRSGEDDIFYGNMGNDVMTGNGGQNTYVFDSHSASSGQVDIITDFKEGDQLLFFEDIFGGGNVIAPLDLIDVSLVNGNSELTLYNFSDGVTEVQQITLQGYTVTDLANIVTMIDNI